MRFKGWLFLCMLSLATATFAVAMAQDPVGESTTQPAGEETSAPVGESSLGEPSGERTAAARARYTEALKLVDDANVDIEEEPSLSMPADDGTAAKRFNEAFQRWKVTLAEMRVLQAEFPHATPADRPAMERRFDELFGQANAEIAGVTSAAEAAVAASPQVNADAAQWMFQVVLQKYEEHDYEEVARLCKLLMKTKLSPLPLNTLAGAAYFGLSDYPASAKHIQSLEGNEEALKELNKFFNVEKPEHIPYLYAGADEKWAAEQKQREADAAAGDLPRVKLHTSKGDIVLELFEDQAPNTVANFISLVEKKYYDGLTFHRVEPHFVAQGGDPKGDGSGGPGYTIADEAGREDHRNHFRGSLSMAKTAAPDTGGSQFFINYRPAPHLDGKHTVFGRVIEGMDVAGRLQIRKTDDLSAAPPDQIISATVLRKRDHAYVPKTITGGATVQP